jgi:hypothetical protein
MMIAFQKTGIDNHRVKGAFMGALSWGFIYNLGSRMRLYSASPGLTKTHFSYLITDVVYGLVTAEAIKALADPNVFNHQLSKGTSTEDPRIRDKEQNIGITPYEERVLH